jgi:hypothetical protein
MTKHARRFQFDRTGTEPTALYTFVGMAEIRALPDGSEFLIDTACEPHADGTCRISEALFEGKAYVWGEDKDGIQLWIREDDEVARKAIAAWESSEALAKARALSQR